MKSINVQTAKTSELVAFYNEHAEQLGKKHITKFADRQTAEMRVSMMIADLEAEQAEPPKPYGFEDHGLTNCPHCNIHLENGVGVHNDEVNGKVIKHDKFQFVCLACGTEFGPEIPGVKPVDEKRSAAIAETWKDEDVRKARSTHNAVEVDGVRYRSVREAFKALGLPDSKHIKFRGQLKLYGEQAFGKHTFVLVQ
jgi:hypothetical protein